MKTLIYAGIGSRATPESILADMTKMATWLARTGWHLASGGAHGADTAFAGGAPAGQRTLYLPWPGYNGHAGPNCHALSRSALSGCMEIAARLHPAWHRCSPAARKLHARNAAILLSSELDVPSMRLWHGRAIPLSREAPGWGCASRRLTGSPS